MKEIARSVYNRFFIGFLFLHFSCTPELDIPKPSAGEADFSKVISMGGNYMAGYQDGALFLKGQKFSIPALLAEQFKMVGGSAFNQALMPDNNGLGLNSKTWESGFLSPFHLGYKTDCKGVTSLFPFNSSISLSSATPYLSGMAGNSVQNLAVPFATINDYFNPSFSAGFSDVNKNPYYNRFASNPGVSTIYADAKAQHATFIIGWLGMEDIYNFANYGGVAPPIPSAASFSAHLDTLLGGLTSNGAKGVIANIPDFRTFPFYTSVTWDNAVLVQSQADSLNDIYAAAGLTNIHFAVGRNGFVIEDVNFGYRQLHSGEYITLSVPIDSVKCYKYGLMYKTIANRYVLDSTEVATIDYAITSYNAVIAQKTAQYHIALVDMHTYFNAVMKGIKWDGLDFNAKFISGGFFSLDGYHPHQKGYALIANEFIRAINTTYKAELPTVNCNEYDGVLFP